MVFNLFYPTKVGGIWMGKRECIGLIELMYRPLVKNKGRSLSTTTRFYIHKT